MRQIEPVLLLGIVGQEIIALAVGVIPSAVLVDISVD
jgi:hypothetical protein